MVQDGHRQDETTTAVPIRPLSFVMPPREVRPDQADVTMIGLPPAPFGDVFHNLMRASWPVFCLIFATYYLLINLLFGALYYLDLAGIQNARAGSFSDAYMFSVQTIATIGYGHLAPVSAFVNAMVVVESIVAFLGLSLWTGLAFARFSRPTARVLFTARAVISNDDGVPTLMFRVANGRGNRIVDASISVTLLRTRRNAEGVEWRRQTDLQLVRERSAVFALSWTVLHRIDAGSPLAGMLPDLTAASEKPELFVTLTGIDDTFGQTVHAMHRYRAADILVGKHFVDLASVEPDGRRILDFTNFDAVVDAATGDDTRSRAPPKLQ